MIINYCIYSGAGNDFVMINNISKKIPFDYQARITRFICEKYFPGIDGVIFLEIPETNLAEVRMNYFNRDGSYGAMCGNGARCTVQFAIDYNIVNSNKLNLESVDKIYKAEYLDKGKIKIFFPDTEKLKLNFKIDLESDKYNITEVHWIYIGSEHIIVFLNDINHGFKSLSELPVNDLGRVLREHKRFQPKGANVNFVKVISACELQIRTYERGVERETLACGTGIISSAIISSLLGFVNPPVKVLVQSGEWLETDFTISGRKVWNISLSGSAKYISKGDIEIDI